MADSKKLHVAVFPWLAFGHMIPFLELGKKIAENGHFVSFISTPRNIKRLPKIRENLSSSINLVELPLPHETNLPQNAEATIDIPYHLIPYLKKAYDGLQETLAHFLQTNTPDWIIYDFAPHWLPPIAARLGISRAFLSVCNASTAAFFGPLRSEIREAYGLRTKPEHFTVPPKWISFPFKSVFRLFEANKFVESLLQNESGVSDSYRLWHCVEGSQLYLLRSCREFEQDCLNLLPELLSKPVIPVGLLLGAR